MPGAGGHAAFGSRAAGGGGIARSAAKGSGNGAMHTGTHSSEGPPPPWHYKTKLCTFFESGCCHRATCNFAHGEAELLAPFRLLEPTSPELETFAGRRLLADWVKPRLEAAVAEARICLQRAQQAAASGSASQAAAAAEQYKRAREALYDAPAWDSMYLQWLGVPTAVREELFELGDTANKLWQQVVAAQLKQPGQRQKQPASQQRGQQQQQRQQFGSRPAGSGGLGGSQPQRTVPPQQGSPQHRSTARPASGPRTPPQPQGPRSSSSHQQAASPNVLPQPQQNPVHGASPPPRKPAALQTQAERLREEGNTLYASAGQAGLSAALQLSRLQQACAKYRAALAASTTDGERATAYKNLGMAALHSLERRTAWEKRERLDHACEVLRSFSRAADYGAACQPPKPGEWVDHCVVRATDAFYKLTSTTGSLQLAEGLQLLARVRAALEDPVGHTAGDLLRRLAATLWKWGVKYGGERKWSSVMQVNAEARRPLEEAAVAARLCGSAELHRKVDDLAAELELQKYVCDSVKERDEADKLLKSAVYDAEELDMEAVHTVIDMFKRAASLTHEVDVENEAVALSRLGNVYRKVLKDHARARSYFRQAMHLASSMFLHKFRNDSWYREMCDALAYYQRADVQREEERQQAEREPYLKKLEPELAALKRAAAAGISALLKHVYAKHPPPNPDHCLKEKPTVERQQALLKRAIVHYHPDKAQQAGESMEWQVLAGEISKYLTERYTCTKM